MSVTKKPPIKKIIQAAEMYQENLLDKNILLVGLQGSEVDYLELRFLARSFKHLTGVRTQSKSVSAMYFWRKCTGHNLSEADLALDNSGFAAMKLRASLSMFRPDLSAREFGRPNGSRLNVDAEVFAGDQQACMGFRNYEGEYLDPMTLLSSPVGKEVKRGDRYKVVGVFSKSIRWPYYTTAIRTASTVDWHHIVHSLPNELKGLDELIP